MNVTFIELYRNLHRSLPAYGTGTHNASLICALCESYKLRTIFDFGCGKGELVRRMNSRGFDAVGYDPAVREFENPPTCSCDLVTAIDVLEHLDPDGYMSELGLISGRANRAIFVSISCRPAYHTFPDGKNCHTLLMKPIYWKKTLVDVWSDFTMIESGFNWHNKSLMMLFIRKAVCDPATNEVAASFNLLRNTCVWMAIKGCFSELKRFNLSF